MTKEPEVLQILKRGGVFKSQDHFVGVSGRHFDTYAVKEILFSNTTLMSRVGELLAALIQDLDIEVVAGPAQGGIILSQWVAFHLSRIKGKEIYSIYTEKAQGNNQVLRRGYSDITSGRKVLVLEDTIRTGGTVHRVMSAIRSNGGEVAAVAAMINSTPELITKTTFGVTFRWLADYAVTSYTAAECPMCKRGVPVNIFFAHGKAFMESRSR